MRQTFSITVLLLIISSLAEAESPTDSVFYRNDGADIGFRVVIEENDNTPWIILQDREGSPQKVSPVIIRCV